MLFRREIPVGGRQVEVGNISASSVEFVKSALLNNLTFAVKRNDVIAVWQPLGCLKVGQ